jgi:hypothetical protein
MTRKRYDPKGDARIGSVQHPPVAQGGSEDIPEAHSNPPGWLDPAWQLELDMIALLARGDGWLRISGDIDGKTVWLKFKLNGTRWPNHYVMTSGPFHQLQKLLHQLRRKLEEVDSGAYKPTTDHYYRSPSLE